MLHYPIIPTDLDILLINYSDFYRMNDEWVFFVFITEKHLPEEECIRLNKPKNYTPTHIIAYYFSDDFKECKEHRLAIDWEGVHYKEMEFFYQENDKFFLNTKYFYHWDSNAPIGKLVEVSPNGMKEIGDAPLPVKYIFSDSKTYEFGDVSVKMKSSFIMECKEKSSKKLIWKLKLRAYLYTEIIEKNGVIYFGTDGNGKAGRMYAVSLNTGEILWEYENHGTSNFFLTEEGIILADADKNIVILNPDTGNQIKKIDLGEMTLSGLCNYENGKLIVLAHIDKRVVPYHIDNSIKEFMMYAVRVEI